MGIEPPFLYDPVKTGGINATYSDFDPKAVTRAANTPRAPRPKHEGPLVSFNQHPDSYLILPWKNNDAVPMSPSVKKWVKWTRIVLMVLRCLQVLCACGLFSLMFLIKNINSNEALGMKIIPGVAVVHTVYGTYHLGRKPSGRTPASSASYMLFASLFDVFLIPFYAIGAVLAWNGSSAGWQTILSNSELVKTFEFVLFILAAVGSGLHLFSLGISLYLAVTFRKITKLPPDMNPLEDNLTSRTPRHKRNKSSMSVATSTSSVEKRLSAPLESHRSSGVGYEDLSRPPTIPFFQTRTQSTTSLSTYRSTPPPSRDARLDLPSRQYQIPPSNSARSSIVSLQRNSGGSFKPQPSSHRSSYVEVPLHDDSVPLQTSPNRKSRTTRPDDAWYGNDSMSNLSKPNSKSSSPRKTRSSNKVDYQPLTNPSHRRQESIDDHPNPLATNPPTPRNARFMEESSSPIMHSPLSEIGHNYRPTPSSIYESSDIGDSPLRQSARAEDQDIENRRLGGVDEFKSKYYGELVSRTPPIMVGAGGKMGRQVSSGNDFGKDNGFRVLGRREVSGKVAEEGLGGPTNNGKWGARFRKGSGL